MTADFLAKVSPWMIGIYIILAMPRVETWGSENKKERLSCTAIHISLQRCDMSVMAFIITNNNFSPLQNFV